MSKRMSSGGSSLDFATGRRRTPDNLGLPSRAMRGPPLHAEGRLGHVDGGRLGWRTRIPSLLLGDSIFLVASLKGSDPYPPPSTPFGAYSATATSVRSLSSKVASRPMFLSRIVTIRLASVKLMPWSRYLWNTSHAGIKSAVPSEMDTRPLSAGVGIGNKCRADSSRFDRRVRTLMSRNNSSTTWSVTNGEQFWDILDSLRTQRPPLRSRHPGAGPSKP